MCRFSVHCRSQFVVVAAYQAVRERKVPSVSISLVNWFYGVLFVKVVMKSVNFFFVNAAVKVSAQPRNQSGIVCRKVSRACSSTCCITISATTTETGDPMVVLRYCL